MNTAARLFGMTEAEIVSMLVLMANWARWLDADGGGGGGQCASIEHRYVAPRPDEVEAERSARDPMRAIDAENVETALSGMCSPSDRQFLIFRHYYSGAAFHGTSAQQLRATAQLCRRFDLKLHEFDRHHVRCLAELRGNLAEVERIRREKGLRVITTDVFRAPWMRPKLA